MQTSPKTSETIHVLFTADENYAVRIPVVLKSIRINNPEITVCVHLISDNISKKLCDHISAICNDLDYSFSLYPVPETLFENAPVNKHYSRAMYYRMLAAEILPPSVSRVLYLDPDILVINPLLPLWNTPLEGNLFAAATHNTEEGITDNINRLRLETSAVYFNTGVLLMDLDACRRSVKKENIVSFIEKNYYRLLLPDQDVFNALYGSRTKQIPDEIWNYDARKFLQYMVRSAGLIDEQWIIKNTVILHYCGKSKPWDTRYRYRFGNLYRHYEWMYKRDLKPDNGGYV